ncbi:hypothetical protein B4U37_01390 [Sutcliffiella horikoshii]|uniref:Uncharacterized protein n=1 Tax=Sutcliffiella horikoshii TaxID=79883 RepID=A0ABM6KEG5_9BACI|nr:hypothetical protein B4U37_01390 [Sutcliffiella horikoshii]
MRKSTAVSKQHIKSVTFSVAPAKPRRLKHRPLDKRTPGTEIYRELNNTDKQAGGGSSREEYKRVMSAPSLCIENRRDTQND